jgi:hypothetical protein
VEKANLVALARQMEKAPLPVQPMEKAHLGAWVRRAERASLVGQVQPMEKVMNLVRQEQRVRLVVLARRNWARQVLAAHRAEMPNYWLPGGIHQVVEVVR